ncbi:response regulator transcription factor [Thalassotalea euphylliae]|uniref:response regulator transcription factor n=1 Tax=Thalassotalea euphylliae TaxID=1655234 RepID=UPI003641A583
MTKVLLVEDDERLANLVHNFLEQQGYDMTTVHRGDDALVYLNVHQPELIILDINLPDTDGFTLCERIRADYQCPILFLTAKDGDEDHLRGLELGADDYLIKPVEPKILAARIKLVLKRHAKLEAVMDNLVFGQLTIKKSLRKVTWLDKPIDMTNHEYELLLLLAEHAGKPVTREYIHQQMIAREYDGLDRTVDVRVSRLRRKFGDDSSTPEKITTVWGKGYMLIPHAWDH